MIKKLSVTIIIFFLIITTGLCVGNCASPFKAVTGDVSINDLYIGISYDDVVSIYGKPDKYVPYYNPVIGKGIAVVCFEATWGNTLMIKFGDDLGNFSGTATVIKAYNSNAEDIGLSTPTGVHIGTSYEEAKMIYGIPSNYGETLFYVVSPDNSQFMSINRPSDSKLSKLRKNGNNKILVECLYLSRNLDNKTFNFD